MNATSQRLCIWCGPAFAVMFLVGSGLFMRIIPPPGADASTSELVTFYGDHRTRLIVGAIISMYSAALMVPWFAGVTVQLKRIEGEHSPLTWAFLALAASAPWVFIVPLYFIVAGAYRPGLDPAMLQTLTDLGFAPYIGCVYTLIIQQLVLFFVTRFDTRADPILPRWFGWVCLLSAVLEFPAGLNLLVTSGPLAWDGLIGFWVLVVTFFVWLAALTWVALRAVRIQEAEYEAAVLPAG